MLDFPKSVQNKLIYILDKFCVNYSFKRNFFVIYNIVY